VVVAGVLSGVVDHGQRLDVLGQVLVAGQQFLDDGRELGDIWPVSGVGVGDDRDAAVAGHHQA